MKKTLLVLTLATLLVFAGSAAWAQALYPHGYLLISEDDTTFLVNSLLTGVTPNFGNITFPDGTGNEAGTLTGTLTSPYTDPSGFLEFGSTTRVYRYVQLWEPGAPEGTVSDIIRLFYDPVQQAPGGYTQYFEVDLASDGAGDFFNTLLNEANADGALTASLFETGSRQDISDLLNTTGSFQMLVSSDVEAVPIPPAVLLFGTGLAGLAGLRRFRKG